MSNSEHTTIQWGDCKAKAEDIKIAMEKFLDEQQRKSDMAYLIGCASVRDAEGTSDMVDAIDFAITLSTHLELNY